jgi:hypothetical protein
VGEAGALGEQVVEVVGGDQLRARLSVHVHELREEELDAVVLDDLANVVFVTGRIDHCPFLYARCRAAQWSRAPR